MKTINLVVSASLCPGAIHSATQAVSTVTGKPKNGMTPVRGAAGIYQ